MAGGSAPPHLYDVVARELRSRGIGFECSILDVGSGHGHLMSRLRALGYLGAAPRTDASP